MERLFNFSAGPAALPLSVLEEAQRDLLCYPGAGCSVMEMSHRSRPYEEIIEEIEKDGVCDYYDKYHKDDNKDDTFKRTYPADISKALTEEIEKTKTKIEQKQKLINQIKIKLFPIYLKYIGNFFRS